MRIPSYFRDRFLRRLCKGGRQICAIFDVQLRSRTPLIVNTTPCKFPRRSYALQMTKQPNELDPVTEKALAIALYNQTKALLRNTSRTSAQDLEMIHMAHASGHHWSKVGNIQNFAIGEWLCSRVYAAVNQPQASLFHALACRRLSDADSVEAWVVGFAEETLVRAYMVNGEFDSAKVHYETAKAIAETLDPESREMLLSDLRDLNSENNF